MGSPSVIIPTHNRADILSETLHTLAGQSFPPAQLEVIVVDDGSTDDTEAVVRTRDYPFRLIYERLEPKAEFCPARPRNHGLRAATGEIVIFLDADVLAGPGLITRHMAVHRAKRRPKAAIGYTYAYPWTPEERTQLAMNPPPPDRLLDELPCLIAQDGACWRDGREPVYAASNDLVDHPAPWQLFWTNNASVPQLLALEIGGFDEDFVGWGEEDLEFAYRLYQQGVEFTPIRSAWGVHYPHPINDLEERQAQLQQNRRRLIGKHPGVPLEMWLWSPWIYAQDWNDVEALLTQPTPLPPLDLPMMEALLDRLPTETFKAGPLLLCGSVTPELATRLQPAAWCQPFPHQAEASAAVGSLPLLGVFTPWDDLAFTGAIITDYWRCLPPAVLAGILAESLRIAECVALLCIDAPAAREPSVRLRDMNACSQALAALPVDWTVVRGAGITAFLGTSAGRGPIG